ncbi:MAG: hypothetical protein STHCBS139747_002963 [Sporothrix thermara]
MGEIRRYQIAAEEAAARAPRPAVDPAIGQGLVSAQNATAQPWLLPFSLVDIFDPDSSDDDDDDYDDGMVATLGGDERDESARRRIVSDMVRLHRQVFGAFSHGYMESQFDANVGTVSEAAESAAAGHDPLAAMLSSSQSPLRSLLSSHRSSRAPIAASSPQSSPTEEEPQRPSTTASTLPPALSSVAAYDMEAESETDQELDDPVDETQNGRYAYFDEIQARVEAGVARLRNSTAGFSDWLTASTSPLPPLPTRNPGRTTTAEGSHGWGQG